jgi:hypothetical protein
MAVETTVKTAVTITVKTAITMAVETTVKTAVTITVKTAVTITVKTAVETMVKTAVTITVTTTITMAVGITVKTVVTMAVGPIVKTAITMAVGTTAQTATGGTTKQCGGTTAITKITWHHRENASNSLAGTVRRCITTANVQLAIGVGKIITRDVMHLQTKERSTRRKLGRARSAAPVPTMRHGGTMVRNVRLCVERTVHILTRNSLNVIAVRNV